MSESDRSLSNEASFTLLDRFPATMKGHFAFLEFVWIEIREQAEALRHGKYPHESIEKQLNQGVKWEEARQRFFELCGLPDDLMKQVSEVLHRQLSIGSVEQVSDLLEPAIRDLRSFVDRSGHLDALESFRRELEDWDSDNSPSESGYLVEPVPAGHNLPLQQPRCKNSTAPRCRSQQSDTGVDSFAARGPMMRKQSMKRNGCWGGFAARSTSIMTPSETTMVTDCIN